MSEEQKALSEKLWEDGNTQNERAFQVRCSQSFTSKITRTCSKRFTCGSKPTTKVTDERELNRILFLINLRIMMKFPRLEMVLVLLFLGQKKLRRL